MNLSNDSQLVELSQQLSMLGETARKLRRSTDLDLHYPRHTSINYETELIQVAASEIAALTDLRLQQGAVEVDVQREIEREISQERLRQDRKFGSMPRNLDPLIWVVVLLEELAEVSEEIWG